MKHKPLYSKKHRSLLIPGAAVSEILHDAPKVFVKGVPYRVLKHTSKNTEDLHHLGIPVKPPCAVYYKWGRKPFASQVATAKLLTTNRRAYVLNEIGTGKTTSALAAFDFLKWEGEVKTMLVISSMSTLHATWENEIMTQFPHLKPIVLHSYNKASRLKRLKEERDIYIINHDGIKVIEEELKAMHFDVVCVDELAVFRNARTKLWKSLNNIVRDAKYAWGMTGSPTPEAPTDAWAQCRVLTPHTVPKFFTHFRDDVMYQASQFDWRPRRDAHVKVFRAMQPSVRFTREECLDLPPTTISYRDVELSSQQKMLYKKLKEEYHAMLAEGEINAANSAVLYSKLLQIAGGFIYTQHKTTVELDWSKRRKTLESVINTTAAKLLVFAPFKSMVNGIYSALLEDGFSVEMIHGDVPTNKRTQIFHQFQKSRDPRILVAHPRTMAHGLTLTEADTILWYAPPPSAEIYEQANGRITRPGQTRNTHIIHLIGSPAEKKAFMNTKKKLSTQALLLDLFEG